ncbi:MAG: DUF2891 domain-containing protein [Gemmatimonas sp.]
MNVTASFHMNATYARKFAGLALAHITREYPHKMDHIMVDGGDVRGPRDLHPIFYGSFDWHSCVHGYWLLARLLRTFPDLPEAPEIHALFDAHLTISNVAVEAAYASHPLRVTFERPYGWAWLLALSAEFKAHTMPHGARWAAALQPLADVFAKRFVQFLPLATYPIRAGTHYNTAFALALAFEYADVAQDSQLLSAISSATARWYAADADAQVWEPSGDDFLSSALVEAECVRRVLPPDQFTDWFGRFLPQLADRRPVALFTPATVSDRTDGKIAHLDGLNLSRAWCWRSLASALDASDPRRTTMLAAADAHLAASLPHVADDYAGEHWLATYALMALEVNGL